MNKVPKNLPKQITDKYDIIGNTFIGKDKGEKNAEREVEIGDIHSDDFQPQFKIMNWENETNMSVRLIDDEPDTPEVKVVGNKIKYIKNKIEAHFYDVPKTGEMPECFEFEVLLLEKPKTNKVEFTTQSKGLKFCYQPTLREKLGKFVIEQREIETIIKKQQFESIVDIGGGTGWFAKILNGTCIDYSDEAYSKKVTENYIKADIRIGVPEIEKKQYDLAVGIGLLKYFQTEKDIKNSIEEIARISKSGIFFVGKGFEFFEDTLPLDRCSTDWNKLKRDFWLEKFALYAPNYQVEIYDISYSKTPENIEGSYAVYHESKAGDYSKMELKNYRAGKAFHIYRPKIIDSAGKEVWGKLNITDNLLTVEVPQEFLDNAVYPVIVDPTFGNLNEGGTTGILVNSTNICFDNATGPAGTGDSMHVYIDPNDGTPAETQMYLYNTSLGKVTNGVTTASTPPNGNQQWVVQNFASTPTLTVQTYYLACWTDGGSPPYGNYTDMLYDTDVGNDCWQDTNESYSSWPATLAKDITRTDKIFSIYCTYTAGGVSFTPKAMFFTFLLTLFSLLLWI